jgi:signal transduction histidine kinase
MDIHPKLDEDKQDAQPRPNLKRPTFLSKLLVPKYSNSPRVRYGAAIIVFSLAFILQYFLRSVISPPPFFLFYPAVFIASWLGGRGPGIFTTVLSGVGGWYFFIPLFGAVEVKNSDSLPVIALFIIMGILISMMNGQIREAHILSNFAKERLKDLVDWLDHAIVWEMDVDLAHCFFVSKGTERLLKFSSQEWIDNPRFLLKQIHPDDREKFVQTARAASTELKDQSCDHRIIDFDGKTVWYHTGIHADFEDDEIKLRGLTVDIHLLKESEERELKARKLAEASQKKLAFLLQATSTMISELDFVARFDKLTDIIVPAQADWCILDILDGDQINRQVAYLQKHQKQGKEYLNLNKLRYTIADQSALGVSRVLRTRKSELYSNVGDLDWQVEIFGKDMPEWFKSAQVNSYLIVPLYARGHTQGAMTLAYSGPRHQYNLEDLALAEDLAYRAAIALDNSKLYEQAKKSIEVREEVLAVVSHDLRNPLGSILMNAAFILRTAKKQPVLPERVVEKIQKIKLSGERMNNLIEDLLNLTKIEAGHLEIEPKFCEIEKIIDDSLEILLSLAEEKSIQIVKKVETDSSRLLECDPYKIMRVFSNVIGNALKFTPEHGIVKIGATPLDEGVQFFVSDTGPGIAEHHLPHIFDRFWQAKQTAHKGTGLGLSISKGIVQAHHGKMWVQSKFGEGSTFYFFLPWKQEQLSKSA